MALAGEAADPRPARHRSATVLAAESHRSPTSRVVESTGRRPGARMPPSPVGERTGDLQLAAVRPVPAGHGGRLLGAAGPAAPLVAAGRFLPLLRRLGLALPRPARLLDGRR